MKNVVIMCDTYLPKASPNGICVSQVAKALAERNDNVRIVTTLNIEGQKAVENIDGVDVYRVDPGFVVRELMATDGKTDSESVKRRNKALSFLLIHVAHARKRRKMSQSVLSKKG